MFLEAFDHPARDVIRVGSLALVFAGALDFDDLRMAALADGSAEWIAAMEIPFTVLDADHQVRMRLNRIAHLLVGRGIMVKRAPGAKNQLLVVLHADFVPQEL